MFDVGMRICITVKTGEQYLFDITSTADLMLVNDVGEKCMSERTVRTPNMPNSSFWANSEQVEHLISSEQHEHRTVRTLKILKISEQSELSEHLLFGLWWALVGRKPVCWWNTFRNLQLLKPADVGEVCWWTLFCMLVKAWIFANILVHQHSFHQNHNHFRAGYWWKFFLYFDVKMFFYFQNRLQHNEISEMSKQKKKLKKRLQIERSVAEISRIRIRKASASANSCDVNPTIA